MSNQVETGQVMMGQVKSSGNRSRYVGTGPVKCQCPKTFLTNEIILDQNFFGPQNIFDPNFAWPENCLTPNQLDQIN